MPLLGLCQEALSLLSLNSGGISVLGLGAQRDHHYSVSLPPPADCSVYWFLQVSFIHLSGFTVPLPCAGARLASP